MTQLTMIKVPASPAQLKYIASLAQAKGQPFDPTIGKADASKEIDRLKALPAAPKAGSPVPLSNYALITDGQVRFYRVAQWKGTTYLRQLIGHPGEWQKIKLSYPAAQVIMARLAANPLAAAQLYGSTYTVCAVCSSPLSDPLSLERKIGPVCWKRFGF